MPTKLEPSFRSGEPVRVRGDRWTIGSVTPYTDCCAVALTGCAAANAGLRRTFLLPFDRVVAASNRSRTRRVRTRAWAAHVAGNVLATHPFGGLRAAASAVFELHPYQLEPALAVLRHGRLRILIADEVGLGKTIQAGLLLNELIRGEPTVRALVLSPAGLREQWERELQSRFSLQPTVADSTWLQHAVRELPADVNPWALPGIYIASLDLVKRPEVLRSLEDVTWDLCIIDEIHTAGPGTARLAAANAIGARSRRILLLTATPPDADPLHADAIGRIGRAPTSAAFTVFRRTRAATGSTVKRKTVLLPVSLAPDEQRMHRLLERYTALIWREATERQDGGARLAATVLRKRALSSAASLLRSVRRRMAGLGSSGPLEERQLSLPLDEDPLEDEAADSLVCASGLADVALERASLDEIAVAAEAATRCESKLHWLKRLLRRINESVLVFTEYRDTLAQIGAFLTPAHDPLLLHGGLSTAERAAVQRAFNASGGLLLATDAASEGLNLHEQCRLVIHFELPWTPTRLQQRTGRVDRIGQSRPVHEVLLVARDTSERLVLAPLLRRARLAAARAGRPSVVIEESRVAAAVMQGAHLDVEEPVPFLPPASLDLTDEARFETERIQLHRRLLQLREPRQEERPSDTVMTIRRHASRVLAIVRVTLRDASERAVHEELIPIRLTDARLPAGGSARQLPAWTHPMVESARQHALVRMDEVITRVREQIRAMAERERELASGLTSPARVLIQPGLFDRRAMRDADARSHVQASILEEIALRLRSLDPDASFDVEASLVGIRSER